MKSVIVMVLKEKFQSTLSVRRATDKIIITYNYSGISIHALREESDLFSAVAFFSNGRISIHALREESDPLTWARRFTF